MNLRRDGGPLDAELEAGPFIDIVLISQTVDELRKPDFDGTVLDNGRKAGFYRPKVVAL